MKSSRAIIGILTTALVLAGCSPAATQPDTTTLPEPTVVQDITPMVEGTSDIMPMEGDSVMEATSPGETVDYTVEMSNFSFMPKKLTMKAGSTIKVKVVNKQGTHDFMIDELNVKTKQMTGAGEEIVEITAPAADAGKSYEFYCSVGKHREMGMVGTLEITE